MLFFYGLYPELLVHFYFIFYYDYFTSCVFFTPAITDYPSIILSNINHLFAYSKIERLFNTTNSILYLSFVCRKSK